MGPSVINPRVNAMCHRISQLKRQFNAIEKMQFSLANQGCSVLRRGSGFKAGKQEGFSEEDLEINAEAKKMAQAKFSLLLKAPVLRHLSEVDQTVCDTARVAANAYLMIQGKLDLIKQDIVSLFERDAPKLVLKWLEETKGIKLDSFALVIAETGDLCEYRTLGGVYKRMGVAVIDGIAQGRLAGAKGAKGDAIRFNVRTKLGRDPTAEDWIRHGHKGSRQAVLFRIIDPIIKAAGKVSTAKGREGEFLPASPYRIDYDNRKALLQERARLEGKEIVPAEKVTKKNALTTVTKGQIDNGAKRWVTKKVLRHLFTRWRLGARLDLEAEQAKAVPVIRRRALSV